MYAELSFHATVLHHGRVGFSPFKRLSVTSCTASSKHPDCNCDCMKAFDGLSTTVWASLGEGSGSWIQADFGQMVQVTGFSYQNRAAVEANKGVTLTFSQGSAQTFTLSEASLASYVLSPAQATTFVKIMVDSHYTIYNNGAKIITFIGDVYTPPGICVVFAVSICIYI